MISTTGRYQFFDFIFYHLLIVVTVKISRHSCLFVSFFLTQFLFVFVFFLCAPFFPFTFIYSIILYFFYLLFLLVSFNISLLLFFFRSPVFNCFSIFSYIIPYFIFVLFFSLSDNHHLFFFLSLNSNSISDISFLAFLVIKTIVHYFWRIGMVYVCMLTKEGTHRIFRRFLYFIIYFFLFFAMFPQGIFALIGESLSSLTHMNSPPLSLL